MSERSRFNSEQDRTYGQLRSFFRRAESEYPAAAKQLVNVVGGLVGEQQTTEKKLREGMENIDVGLAMIGDWLKETAAEGFEVKLGLGGGVKKSIGRSQVNFPTASDLIRVKGRVDSELQKQIPPLLASFSRQIRGGLDIGLSPRQIVGGLVAESVGSRPSADGSANLRQALNKPLAGHFEWIREALKIPDAAGQPGFQPLVTEPKPAAAPKPLPEVSRAEAEFIRKKNRIKQYLIQEDGMDFLVKTWDTDKWEHVGDDGSVKMVYRPLSGILADEEVCLRKNISDQITSPSESASNFRPETRFLQNVKGPHFVRVYAHAPLDQADSQGVGRYKADSHWELVDFIEGAAVARKNDREHNGIYWPEPLSPAVRLKVLLAACENEHEALSLARPVYLTDLKTAAFIVSQDGNQIKQVDCQIHNEYFDSAHPVIAKELVRLCLELFPGNREFNFVDIEKAIGWYLNPQQYENDKRWFYGGQNPPILTEILGFSRSALPAGVELGLLRFLDEIKEGSLPVGRIPMRLAERILPIVQKLEREEGASRGEKMAAEKREEVKRRALKREEETMSEEETDLGNFRQAAIMIFGANERELDRAVTSYYAGRFADNPELGRTQLFADTMHTAIELGIILEKDYVFERKGSPEEMMRIIQKYNSDQSPESARPGLSLFITFLHSLSELQRRKIAADSFQDQELPKLFLEQFYANVFYSYWAKSKGLD